MPNLFMAHAEPAPDELIAQRAKAAQVTVLKREAALDTSIKRRNGIIRQLRASKPRKWTYVAIARLTGLSPESIAKIINP